MPSLALSTAEDKNKVRRALPTAKIYAATVARLYVAYPNPHKWAYSNIWGAVAFLKDKKKHSYYLRIIDLIHHRGVVWEQELYDGFEFTQHTSFFYSFATDEYMAGLSFTNEEDAEVFYNKISTREAFSSKASNSAKKAKDTAGKKPKGKLDKSLIGLPSEFRHLGHIGYTPEKGFSVQNTDPEWNGLFDQLKDLGISAKEIHDNEDFIKDFVNQRGGPPPPPPRVGSTGPSLGSGKTRAPPPPPPSRRQAPPPAPVGGRRPPPPPPPSRRNHPPPPPTRHNAASNPAGSGSPVPRSAIPAPPPPPPPGRQLVHQVEEASTNIHTASMSPPPSVQSVHQQLPSVQSKISPAPPTNALPPVPVVLNNSLEPPSTLESTDQNVTVETSESNENVIPPPPPPPPPAPLATNGSTPTPAPTKSNNPYKILSQQELDTLNNTSMSSMHTAAAPPPPPPPPPVPRVASTNAIAQPSQAPSAPLPPPPPSMPNQFHGEQQLDAHHAAEDDDDFHDAMEAPAPPPLSSLPTKRPTAPPSQPPPPPVPPMPNRSVPPPPPPLPNSSRRGGPPPPPPTSQRPNARTAAPTSALPPPPPPPPAPPMPSNGMPPPPPPPPPPMPSSNGAPAPPPPPPPPAASTPPATNKSNLPVVTDARSALLDAIRGAGGISSLRSTPVEAKRDRSSPLTSNAASGATGSGGSAPANDLTASLLAALNDRKKAVTQSDDEDSDSDDGSEWDD